MHEPKTSTGGILHTPNNYAAPVRPGVPLLPSERKNADGTASRVGDETLRSALARAAGTHLPDWPDVVTPHVLRHFCASQLYLGGMDLIAIQATLGHAWIATTMQYVKRPRNPYRGQLDRRSAACRRPFEGIAEMTGAPR